MAVSTGRPIRINFDANPTTVNEMRKVMEHYHFERQAEFFRSLLHTEYMRIVKEGERLVQQGTIEESVDELRDERRRSIESLGRYLQVFKNLAWFLFQHSDVKGLDNKNLIFEPQDKTQIQEVVKAMRLFLEQRNYRVTHTRIDSKSKDKCKSTEYQLTEKMLTTYERYLELHEDIKTLSMQFSPHPSLPVSSEASGPS